MKQSVTITVNGQPRTQDVEPRLLLVHFLRDGLGLTRGGALLSGVSARLRRDAGFPREAGKKFKVPALFSDEPLRGQQVCEADAAAGSGGAALGCAGYGSMVTVTAAMGLAAAQAAIDHLVRPPKVARQPFSEFWADSGHRALSLSPH